MPTVLRIGPYSFVFFSSDGGEPPHIHVKRDRRIAKFWLSPVKAGANQGFLKPELRRVARLVRANEVELLEAWHEYFGA